MPTSPPSITTLPAAPDPSNRSTFNSLAYPWSAALPTFGTEVSAVAVNVKANADEAAAQVTLAADQVALAADQVALAADQVGLAAAQVPLAAAQVALATTQADNAAASAAAADLSVIAAAAATGALLWVSGTSYTAGTSVVYSPINFLTYRRIVSGAGTTDPSLDPTNWQSLMPYQVGGQIYSSLNFGGF